MRGRPPALALCLGPLLAAACATKAPAPADDQPVPDGAPEPGVDLEPIVIDPAEPQARREPAAGTPEQVRAGASNAPPRPPWWFDGRRRAGESLAVCLAAVGATAADAREAVTESLLQELRLAYGDALVDVGITQDLTLLPDGRVRLSALFEITPREGSDG